MLKVLDLNLDLTNYFNESPICAVLILGNKIYKKKILDKKYKFWLKFKNATKAKKFMKKIVNDFNLQRFGNMKNVYLSDREVNTIIY